MVRVVIDAFVFVRALLNRRSLWGTLVFDRADEYRLVVSSVIAAEVTDVLSRSELARRFRNQSGASVDTVLAILASAEWIAPDPPPRISRDPKDDIYPATAAAAAAAFVVSEDRDLLDIGADEGVRIIDAEAFLRCSTRPCLWPDDRLPRRL